MNDYRDGRGRKLVRLHSVCVREYDNGENDLSELVWDPPTKAMFPRSLGSFEQPAKNPFTVTELLLVAASEAHGRYLEDHGQLF